jgi:hypothetical protein
MRKWFRAVGFVLMLLPTVVEAQQGSLEGKWYGVIKEYHFGEPRRNLTISFAGSTPICIWQEIGKAVDRTSLSIQSNTIRTLRLASARRSSLRQIMTLLMARLP